MQRTDDGHGPITFKVRTIALLGVPSARCNRRISPAHTRKVDRVEPQEASSELGPDRLGVLRGCRRRRAPFSCCRG